MTDQPTLTFGDDSSAGADTAWTWISSHAWPGWRLDVITAQEPPPGPPPLPGDAQPRPWDPPHPRQPDAGRGWREVRHLSVRADPRVALLHSTDLLVVGPRGPGLLKALHLGSTVEWLLQHPPSPLVIARAARPTRRALICPDGSPHALAAVHAFAAMPSAKEAEALVLVVDDGRSHAGGADDAVEALSAAGVAVRRITAKGKPTTAIGAAIEQHGADLVVLGTRGLTGLRRMRLGSTAGAVARSAPCAVLLACVEVAEPDYTAS